jgi:polysaccharide biosynthesis/export protein
VSGTGAVDFAPPFVERRVLMDLSSGNAMRAWPAAPVEMMLKVLGLAALVMGAHPVSAAEEDSTKPAPSAYRLSPGDLIELSVFGVPEFNTSQRLNADGIVQIPLLGGVPVTECTIPEAQARVAAAFLKSELLVKPSVTIVVREYAVRQALVYGQVATPGPVRFPPEKYELDLVEVIAMAGGFTEIAKKKLVTITRIAPDGTRSTQAVNVGGMIDGLRREAPPRVFVRPGDVINVDEIVI